MPDRVPMLHDVQFYHGLLVLQEVLPVVSETTRITEKGQTTIPKALREKYDLDPGDEVVWIDMDEGSS